MLLLPHSSQTLNHALRHPGQGFQYVNESFLLLVAGLRLGSKPVLLSLLELVLSWSTPISLLTGLFCFFAPHSLSRSFSLSSHTCKLPAFYSLSCDWPTPCYCEPFPLLINTVYKPASETNLLPDCCSCLSCQLLDLFSVCWPLRWLPGLLSDPQPDLNLPSSSTFVCSASVGPGPCFLVERLWAAYGNLNWISVKHLDFNLVFDVGI